MANRMIQHRGYRFTFVHHNEGEPTNEAAERALRPAVIARKLSAGNRSPSRSPTPSISARLAPTARQNGQDFVRAAKAIPGHRDADDIAPVLPQLVTA